MPERKIFISHISKERELAELLKKHISEDYLGAFEIFVSSDGKSIQAGKPWLTEVEQALEEAKIEFILCSKESVGKPWVNFEAGAAWKKGIQIIPLCHSGFKPHDLPLPLSLLQALEINQSENIKFLYEAISKTMDMQKVPNVNFDSMATEIIAIENKYKQADEPFLRIDNPKILCAASPQYSKLDFDLDVKVLETIFSDNVIVERNLTSKKLRELLTNQHFDIIHLVVAVDINNGDIMFSPIDTNYTPVDEKPDKLSAEGFARLAVETNTSLVVLATCDSLALAVEVASITNMIAANGVITGELVAQWSEWFYELIRKGYPLYKAYEITKDTISSAQLRLVRNKNVVFSQRKA